MIVDGSPLLYLLKCQLPILGHLTCQADKMISRKLIKEQHAADAVPICPKAWFRPYSVALTKV